MTTKPISKYSRGLLDFHNHSTYSDGGDTPAELVRRAKSHGVSAMALTDHHTHTGLPEFREACKEQGIFAIPFGAEIAAELPPEVLSPTDNESPDLVLLGKNADESPMRGYQVRYTKDVRERFLPETLYSLEKVGFEIPPVDLDAQCATMHCPPDILHSFVSHGKNLERLIKYVKSVDPEVAAEAVREKPIRFANKHLYAVGCPAYVKRFQGFNVDDAINLAGEMNCKLFIAHPGGEYGFLSDAMLNHFIEKGVQGIEVRSYFNSPEQNAKFDRLATEHKLIRSGGSDCHGNNGPFKSGIYDKPQNQLPKDILEELWDNLPS